ncbi:MAG: class I SAM-dependent methyltransferase [Kineosporiaceae bacterium]
MYRDTARERRLRRLWDRQAADYDEKLAWVERRYLAATRPWLCGRATGEVLEVGVGTGLNLPHYPARVQLTGVELSEGMLGQARRRAADLGRPADLRQGDAHALPFPDARFDSVLCSFALCGITDPPRALAEMVRVLRPGGLLLLADHVMSTAWPVRWAQATRDLVSIPLYGEHWRHRSLPHVHRLGLPVEEHERFSLGIIERLVARRPEES